VGVHDARPRAADGGGHVAGVEPALQQADRGATPAERGGVARDQLGVLAQALADQPQQVVDDPLLAAGGAIAVVQEEDQAANLDCGAVQAAVVVPTKDRASYLDVALEGVCAQAREAGAEVLVVDDGPTPATRAVAGRHGARYVAHESSRGLNAARNTGLTHTTAELVCFVDDDVRVRPGWLGALIDGARRNPGHGCLTGPVHAVFEGYRPRFCGREGPPITFLDLGPEERDAPHAWGANLAVRRSAVERVGRFDESLGLYGDEQEWEARLHAAGGRIRWLPGAALEHRRAGDDARVSSLARAARARGRAGRREDVAKGTAPPLGRELRVLAGALLHGPRFRCANGPIFTAHSIGRIEEALRPAPSAADDDFLSGSSGFAAGRRATLRAAIDPLLDLAWRRGPSRSPRRRVLVLSVVRPAGRWWPAAEAVLRRSSHDVEIRTTGVGGRGKFENLNALLGGDGPDHDWLLVVDDDVALPPGFLDRFLAVAERFELKLAQPAHRLSSHAAWPVTRRRPASIARETAFVEIGPVTAFHRDTFGALLPFPQLRMGWGLDAHWSAVARERGWRIGVVDATPIHHATPVADGYARDEAIAEARAFLAGRPYVRRDEARTLRTHR
jgi:GT2 family glycosyltransferase